MVSSGSAQIPGTPFSVEPRCAILPAGRCVHGPRSSETGEVAGSGNDTALAASASVDLKGGPAALASPTNLPEMQMSNPSPAILTTPGEPLGQDHTVLRQVKFE